MAGRFLGVCLTAVALTATSAGVASAQWRESYPVLRIGLASGPNPVLARTQAEPFRAYLERELGVSVEILTSSDYASLIVDQFTGRLHATFLSASAFAGASASCRQCVEPLVAPTTLDGEAGYRAALIVQVGTEIDGPEDLPGSRLAVSAEDSLAGRLVPLALFLADGIDFSTVQIVGRESPAEAILSLMDETADAALGWVGLSGAADERGAIALLAGAGLLLPEDVEIVWTSPMIPHGPMTVLANLPDDLKTDLSEAMIDLADPDALRAVNGGLGGGFAVVDAEDYAPVILLADPTLELPR